ncbi:MAG: hypothetical protein FE78DRAFT_83471 [Acidomyces sp. 'richmondensis']|nr:MAG: hypothetical protein FE78DRAFT_83471 [Acidomyces sp. 'richmondensis']
MNVQRLTVLKILLIAGTSPNLGFAYDLFYILTIYVKIAKTWRKSAGVKEISSLEASQRLNAENLIYAYLVGLFEGNGFFSVSKKDKYFQCEIGVGTIGFRDRGTLKTVYLRIRNKDHLIKYIFPIFDKYPMFSNKQYDYMRLKQILLSDIVFFDISQTNGETLIMAVAEHLSLTTKIYKDKTNSFKLKVTSVRSIENVISFLKKAPLKLLGNKRLQYLLFIKTLRTIPRYSEKINIPSKY